MGFWGRAFAVLAIVGLTVGGLAMWQLAQLAKSHSNSPNLLDTPRHPVTEPMWQQARAVAGKPAPNFTLLDPAGASVTLRDECKKGPVVLVFTKDGCPCSMEAQVFFNRLAIAYKGKATFFGVIDAVSHVASKYRDDFSVPYQMLLGADGAVYKSFFAHQSVYTTLVGPDGTVVKQWPGYSKSMLAELDAAIALAAKTNPVAIDAKLAPEKMNSGCPFD